MSKIVAFTSLTLDGVMQAPGRPDEDTRGGFEHGGWAVPYSDEVMGKVAGESMASTGALLFGRRTYEDFYKVWPNQKDNPFTDVLNNSPKYVASRSLHEPLPWQNSTLLEGDATDAVAGLRAQQGKDIVILGSGDLIRSLLPKRLIDRFVLVIHPLVLGSGQHLFGDDHTMAEFGLVETTTTPKGVIVATYEVTDPKAREDEPVR
jgi:dihydrofolate reductase